MSELELLEELRRFIGLQIRLVSAWKALSPESVDSEWLLDFPKHTVVPVDGTLWSASRHGAGVAFRGQGKIVDVTRGIAHPELCDSDRFYDYLESRGLLFMIEGEESGKRDSLACTLDALSRRGDVECHEERAGRKMFSVPAIHDRSAGKDAE